MALLVERASRADRESLLDLLGAQLEEHAIDLTREGLAHAVDGMLDDPMRGAFLVARLAGETVGVACISYIWTLEHGGRSAWLDELYVRPSHRAEGLGTALVRAVIAEAACEGCAAIDLEVEASHARVEALYAREGFTRHQRARWVRLL
jgi:GNAT superfamily N-acetyltransferase